jgi:hypothetical protein
VDGPMGRFDRQGRTVTFPPSCSVKSDERAPALCAQKFVSMDGYDSKFAAARGNQTGSLDCISYFALYSDLESLNTSIRTIATLATLVSSVRNLNL